MKYAVALIVLLGFVALLEAAPAPSESESLIENDNQDASIAEANCDKKKKSGDAAGENAESNTDDGKKAKGGKKGGKGGKKGKKGGKKESDDKKEQDEQ